MVLSPPNRLQVRFGRQVRGNGRFLIPIYLDNLKYFTNLTSSAILGWLWWFTMTSQWGRDNPNNSIESQFSWLRWLCCPTNPVYIYFISWILSSWLRGMKTTRSANPLVTGLFVPGTTSRKRWMTFDGQPKKNMLMDAMTWCVEKISQCNVTAI